MRWRWQCSADLMAGVDDLARERRVALDLLADEEERGGHALAGEHLEHRGRALRVRPVVERERIARAARRAILDAERRPQRLHRPREPRAAGTPPPPRRRGAGEGACRAAMIVGRHGTRAGNPRGLRGLDALQPRDRAAGARRARGPTGAHAAARAARRLVRRSRWLLGTGLSILGFPLQFIALLLAPLVVVQPALAAGLLVLLYSPSGCSTSAPAATSTCASPRSCSASSAWRSRRRRAAPTQRGRARSRSCSWRSVWPACCPTAAPLGRSLARRHDDRRGAAFGWSGVATKLATDDFSQGHYGTRRRGRSRPRARRSSACSAR